jgi:hypothetical protein
MTWKPIETAPKNGTQVDIWVVAQDGKGWREPDAYWPKEGWRENCWHVPNTDLGSDGPLDSGLTATHWMPLPEPPADP